jgi:hypothetical protein
MEKSRVLEKVLWIADLERCIAVAFPESLLISITTAERIPSPAAVANLSGMPVRKRRMI